MEIGPARPEMPRNGVARDDMARDAGLSLGAIYPVRSHVAFITIFVLSAALSALGLTYVYSERFAAETNTYFKPAEVTRLSVQETRALGAPVPTTPFKVIGQTLDGLIKSDALLRQTVLDLELDAPEVEDFSGPWYRVAYQQAKQFLSEYGADAWSLLQYGRIIEENRTAKAIRELRKNTKIVSEDSYVFTLRTLAKTPQRAASTANDLASKLIALINGEDQRSASRRGEQLGKLRADKLLELVVLEASIRDLLQTVSTASIDTEIEQSTARLSQLELQRTDAAASLRQEESRAAAFAGRLRAQAPSLGPRGDDDGRTRPSDRLGADDFSKLTAEKLAAESRATGLRARFEVLQRDADLLSARLRQLNQVRSQTDLLSAQLQGAKRDLVALTDALQETEIKANSAQGELRVQSPAQVPQSPISPIKIYHVGLAAALAAVFGTGMAMLLSYFNIRMLMVGEKWRTLALPDARAATSEVARIDAG